MMYAQGSDYSSIKAGSRVWCCNAEVKETFLAWNATLVHHWVSHLHFGKAALRKGL